MKMPVVTYGTDGYTRYPIMMLKDDLDQARYNQWRLWLAKYPFSKPPRKGHSSKPNKQ